MQSRSGWGVGLVMVVAACGGESDRQLPSIDPVEATTPEDTGITVPVLEQAHGLTGGNARVTGASSTAPARISVARDGVVIVPPLDFNGTLLVTYAVSSDGGNATGTIKLTVTPVNDAPTASDARVAVHGATGIALIGSDVDADPLTYEIVTPPSHGAIAGTPPAITYTPSPGFVGTDAFTFRTRDGALSSAVAMVTLMVMEAAPPIALAQDVQLVEDNPADVTLTGSSTGNLPLTYQLVAPPAHGTLTGEPPLVHYVPDHDFNGVDQLTFTVSDGTTTSSAARVRFDVLAVNDAPVAAPRAVTLDEDTTTPITLLATDVDGNVLTYLVTAPAHGQLSGTPPNLVYTPAPNYNGPDSFTFTASDFQSTSAPATVTITVAAVEDLPSAASFTQPATEDTPATFTLRGSDPDGASVTLAIATPPAHGTLTGVLPAVIYTPAADFNGTDTFTYTAATADGAVSSPATVTLQVAAVNDAPTAHDITVTTSEDTAVNIALPGSDIDSTSLTFNITALPGDGTLTGTGGNRVYTPAANASGSRSFTFAVIDNFNLFATATVHIEITPVQDPPVARDNAVFTELDTPVTVDILADDSDVDGDVLTVATLSAPAHGTVTREGGELTYTPNAGFTGTEDLTYTVSDGHGNTATAHVVIGVDELPPGLPDDSSLRLSDSSSQNGIGPASMSSDGRFVAFASALPLTADDTNGELDVFVLDRATSAIERVSVASDGAQANGLSVSARISGTGRYVAFASDATNLAPGPNSAFGDLYRHDRVTGQTVRISGGLGGAAANGISVKPTISDDGNLVAFTSAAFNLVADDANGATDVFVRDVAAGTTTRVSLTATGGDTDGTSNDPEISGDGRVVSFTSFATNLVEGDSNNVSDVFVRDLVAGTLQRVSVSSNGVQADRACRSASLSRDGRFVSFLSDATTLAPGTVTGVRAYTRDRQATTTTRTSAVSNVTLARLSGDGRYMVLSSSSGVTVFDRFAGANVSSFSPGSNAAISSNGRYVAIVVVTSTEVRLQLVRNPR